METNNSGAVVTRAAIRERTNRLRRELVPTRIDVVTLHVAFSGTGAADRLDARAQDRPRTGS